MPKENKSSSRRSWRHSLEANDVSVTYILRDTLVPYVCSSNVARSRNTAWLGKVNGIIMYTPGEFASLQERSSPCIRDSVKTPLGSKRYSPFQRDSTRRDSRGSRDFKELRESADIKSRRDSRDSRDSKERRDSRDSRDSNELQIRDSRDLSPSRAEKESMTVTLHKNNSIIGNGIKYIMFPLHLLHLCIFGTSTTAASAEELADKPQSEKVQEEQRDQIEKEDNKEKKEDKDERRSRKDCSPTQEAKSLPREKSPRNEESKEKSERRSKSPLEEVKPKPEAILSEDDDDSDEMVTAPEDSDSASDHWCSANDSMLMNMSVEYDHGLEKSMSFALEEPMDVSMEEHFERLFPSTKGARDERRSRKDEKISATPRKSRSSQQESSRFRSIDEEISTIFQKQCTSSEDESPAAARAAAPRSARESKTPCRTESRDLSAGSRIKKTVSDNNNNSGERENKSAGEYEEYKRRKTSRENDASQKRSDRRNEEIIEEKYRSRQDTPSKRRSRSSRTPSKARDTTKRREVKCKEIGIQTDSAFSDFEEDVEMTPLESKNTERWAHKSCRRLHTGSSQVEDMDQDLDYIADNEDSNDGYVNFVRKRISSGSTSSSSSTDLGFDERASLTTQTNYRLSRWKIDSEEPPAFGNRLPLTRAPPGFPKQPQHPPLTSCVYRNSTNYVSTQSVTLDKRYDHLLGSSVPRAPTPMRHLYYNYPEFMDLPENVGSSKILWNIIRNNYR